MAVSLNRKTFVVALVEMSDAGCAVRGMVTLRMS